MLFVFGKRAKQLRLNKVSELIHTSANHSDIDFARVSVYFHEIVDNGDDFDVVEGSEMVVTRTAHSNNTSKYYLNEKLSNFTEVTNTLRAKGIDLDHNRFLILQGEVEQISMMKPKAATPHDEGLLEYLEDIIGTNKYIEKIEELGKNLEEVTEQRDSHVQRLKHVEKERDGLEGARKEAEAYMAKENELVGWQSVLYRLYINQTEANIIKLNESKAQLDARLQEEKQKQDQSDAALKAIKVEYEAGVKELDVVQAEMDKTGNEFKDFERRDVKYREDLKHMKTKMKKASEKASNEEKKSVAALEEATNLSEELPDLERRIVDAEQAVGPADAELAKLEDGIKSEVNGYRMDLEKVQSELVPWEKSIAEAKAKLDMHESEKNTLVEKHKAAADALESAVESLKKAEETHETKLAECDTINATLSEKRTELEDLVEKETALAGECQKLESNARNIKARHQERKAAQDAVKSRGQILSSLMAAKASGKIAGIWGRLGDLGAVDKRFDVAASTSSGALDYIVVNDTAAAQKCVSMLREKGLGVATFLILDKQKHLIPACQERVDAPEGAHRLFDLIKVSHDELKPAFFYAFRNTVVADDLDQASRIAYGADKRWRRVVTLDGQLIESTGTISGGGSKPKGGRICVGSVKAVANPGGDDVDMGDGEDDEKALKDVEAKLKTARKELKDVQSKIRAVKERISKVELSLKKVEANAASCQENAESLRAQMKSLEADAQVPEDDKKRLKALSKATADAEKELEKHRKGSASLHEKVQALKTSIDEAGGQPMKDARARVAELRETIESLTKAIPQTKVKITSQEKAAKKAEKAAADAKAEAEKLAVDIDELKDSFKSIESEALVVMERLKEAQNLQAEKAEALKELTARYDDKKDEAAKMRTASVDIEAKLDDCSKSLTEEELHKKHWHAELEKCTTTLAERSEDGNAALIDDEELSTYSIDDAKRKVSVTEAELEKMRPDMSAIEAYKQKDAEYAERLAGLEEISKNREQSRTTYEALRRKRLDEFMAGFNIISMKLKEMYQMITLGGDAELELVDSLDPFSEGIVFSVRPPKKSWKNICNLSGGEKTLSSLALVFALHHFKPTPLYVMDEIDAALDFKNVSIVAHYIKERTKDAQFVIISLRNNMFELADRLVGIYKTDNCTKSVTINPGNFTVGEQTTPMVA